MTSQPLATHDDVEVALGRPLAADELAKVEGLIEEAADQIRGYLGHDPQDNPARTLARVAARMAARVLETGQAAGGVFGATSTTDQIGDFSQTRSFPAGTTSGGPWLSSTDKTALKPWKQSGPFAVDTAPGTRPAAEHAPACAMRFGLPTCSCAAGR